MQENNQIIQTRKMLQAFDRAKDQIDLDLQDSLFTPSEKWFLRMHAGSEAFFAIKNGAEQVDVQKLGMRALVALSAMSDDIELTPNARAEFDKAHPESAPAV